MIMVGSTQNPKSLIVNTMSTLDLFFSLRRLTNYITVIFGEKINNLLGV